MIWHTRWPTVIWCWNSGWNSSLSSFLDRIIGSRTWSCLEHCSVIMRSVGLGFVVLCPIVSLINISEAKRNCKVSQRCNFVLFYVSLYWLAYRTSIHSSSSYCKFMLNQMQLYHLSWFMEPASLQVRIDC